MIFCTQESDLKFETKIVSLYFYASWIPYHNKISNMIDQLQMKYKDISFFAIDADYFKGLCKRFNITSIPEVVILVDGKNTKRINGLILPSVFRSVFGDIYNSCNTITGEIL